MPERQNRRAHSVLYLRIPPDERDLLRQAAERMGMSETQLVRLLIRNAPFLTVAVVPSPIAPNDPRIE